MRIQHDSSRRPSAAVAIAMTLAFVGAAVLGGCEPAADNGSPSDPAGLPSAAPAGVPSAAPATPAPAIPPRAWRAGSVIITPTPAPAGPAAPPVLTPDEGGGPISSAHDIAYTSAVACPGPTACRPELDIYAPQPAATAPPTTDAPATGPATMDASPASPLPVIVVLRGGPSGPGGRQYLADFSRALAGAGAIVFNADYRDTRAADGGGDPQSFDDVACAVRTARAWAPAYGGDASRIAIVGHSLGAYVGSVVALGGDDFAGDCPAGGSGLPQVFVGIAGPYQLAAPEINGDFTTMFGAPWSSAQAGMAAVDPFLRLTGNPGLRVRLIYGTSDATVNPQASVAFGAALAGAGHDVDLRPLPGEDHNSVINPGGAAGTVAQLILQVAAAVR